MGLTRLHRAGHVIAEVASTTIVTAGSTMLLDRDKPHLRGMPSTAELTDCLFRLQFPQVILPGTPFVQTDQDKKPFVDGRGIPVFRLLFRALSDTFTRRQF